MQRRHLRRHLRPHLHRNLRLRQHLRNRQLLSRRLPQDNRNVPARKRLALLRTKKAQDSRSLVQ
jgi:hypothetical protein